jgi:hypothetical protein
MRLASRANGQVSRPSPMQSRRLTRPRAGTAKLDGSIQN